MMSNYDDKYHPFVSPGTFARDMIARCVALGQTDANRELCYRQQAIIEKQKRLRQEIEGMHWKIPHSQLNEMLDNLPKIEPIKRVIPPDPEVRSTIDRLPTMTEKTAESIFARVHRYRLTTAPSLEDSGYYSCLEDLNASSSSTTYSYLDASFLEEHKETIKITPPSTSSAVQRCEQQNTKRIDSAEIAEKKTNTSPAHAKKLTINMPDLMAITQKPAKAKKQVTFNDEITFKIISPPPKYPKNLLSKPRNEPEIRRPNSAPPAPPPPPPMPSIKTEEKPKEEETKIPKCCCCCCAIPCIGICTTSSSSSSSDSSTNSILSPCPEHAPSQVKAKYRSDSRVTVNAPAAKHNKQAARAKPRSTYYMLKELTTHALFHRGKKIAENEAISKAEVTTHSLFSQRQTSSTTPMSSGWAPASRRTPSPFTISADFKTPSLAPSTEIPHLSNRNYTRKNSSLRQTLPEYEFLYESPPLATSTPVNTPKGECFVYAAEEKSNGAPQITVTAMIHPPPKDKSPKKDRSTTTSPKGLKDTSPTGKVTRNYQPEEKDTSINSYTYIDGWISTSSDGYLRPIAPTSTREKSKSTSNTEIQEKMDQLTRRLTMSDNSTWKPLVLPQRKETPSSSNSVTQKFVKLFKSKPKRDPFY